MVSAGYLFTDLCHAAVLESRGTRRCTEIVYPPTTGLRTRDAYFVPADKERMPEPSLYLSRGTSSPDAIAARTGPDAARACTFDWQLPARYMQMCMPHPHLIVSAYA